MSVRLRHARSGRGTRPAHNCRPPQTSVTNPSRTYSANAYRGDPWALKVPITGPPLGHNNVRWLEFGLSVLRETLLSAQQKLSTVLTLSAFVRGEETLRTDILTHVTNTGQMPPDYGQVLTLLIDPAHFPEVHKAITAGSLADDDPDDIGMDAEFEFGLERILDGVEALVRAARRARPKAARRD